ncbi:hypothetical protein OAH87_05470 [Marinomonas sp.]|nr:hypothetical protein [Marinomonas sp.]MDB4837902.1 hypothetical protein [Marinomonas sp.]
MILRWGLFFYFSLFSCVSFTAEKPEDHSAVNHSVVNQSVVKTVENVTDKTKEMAQTMFELERGVAILQLSKANLDDYRNMEKSLMSLGAVVDFFAALTCALLIALVVLIVQVHRLKARLSFIEEQERPQANS